MNRIFMLTHQQEIIERIDIQRISFYIYSGVSPIYIYIAGIFRSSSEWKIDRMDILKHLPGFTLMEFERLIGKYICFH